MLFILQFLGRELVYLLFQCYDITPVFDQLIVQCDQSFFKNCGVEDQRECSKANRNEAYDLEVKINDYPIQVLEKYRLVSPERGVEFIAAENVPFFSPPGEDTGASDGYWILLKLPLGENNLSFKGSVDLNEFLSPDIIFTTGASYNLKVIRE